MLNLKKIHQFVLLVVFGVLIVIILSAFSTLVVSSHPSLQTQATPMVGSSSSSSSSGTIKNWYLYNWSQIYSPYSCHNGVAGCWANPDYHKNSWMLSMSSVYIDPSWSNPALTYWTKYYSKRLVTFCYVEVQTEGEVTWDRIKAIGGRNEIWHQVYVNLKDYSGKKIQIKFYCQATPVSDLGERQNHVFNKQILYVQDVSVVPNAPAQ